MNKMRGNPAIPNMALQQAVARHKAGQLAEACDFYRQALQENPDQAEVHYNLANALNALSRTEEAKGAYQKAITLMPGLAKAHYNLANLHRAQGAMAAAIASYRNAVRAKPDFAEAYNNLGTLLLTQGDAEAAITTYRRALATRPDYAVAHNNMGSALKSLGRLDEAAASCRQALAIDPRYAEAHNNLGTLHEAQGRAAEAQSCFRQAIAFHPAYAEAHNNLGNILMQCTPPLIEEAIGAYRRAVAIDPYYIEAFNHLGVALCEDHHIEEGFAQFTHRAELAYAGGALGLAAPPHRLRHDDEQRAYHTRRGSASLDIHGKLHIEAGARLSGATLSPQENGGIEQRWRTSNPQIVVIDNLLTPEALEQLRRFCLGSTIWRETFEDGYVGARCESGFASPLMAQIAEELRAAYFPIFRNHPLLYAWSFKYDQALQGTQIHADFAAVNVNFWITPDEANLDSESGGLIVWDVAAPQEWDFKNYNRNEKAIRSFLKSKDAVAIRIPYRANRAVIFDSDLFHETDAMQFRSGYENRRINVTLLYGRRNAPRDT
jgi:tetratricopeptide (TPR) repeat protein